MPVSLYFSTWRRQKNGSERFVPEISGRPVTTRPITTVVEMSENWPVDFPIANVTSMSPLPTSRRFLHCQRHIDVSIANVTSMSPLPTSRRCLHCQCHIDAVVILVGSLDGKHLQRQLCSSPSVAVGCSLRYLSFICHYFVTVNKNRGSVSSFKVTWLCVALLAS